MIDDVVYIACVDKTLYAVNALSGALKWSQPTHGIIGPTLAASDDILYYSNTDGQVVALHAADGVVYVGSMDNKLYAINTADGKVKWSAPTNSPILSSPSVMDSTGIIYQPHTAGDQ